jgi:hypothetical protein
MDTEENKQAQEKNNSDSSFGYLLAIIMGLMSFGNSSPSFDISKYEFDSLKDRYHELDKRVALLEAKLSSKE